MLMIPRALPWARSFCPFRAYGANLACSIAFVFLADLVLFFFDRNGAYFLTKQQEDLVYLVES